MTEFRVPLVSIDRVEDHPKEDASHLTINYFKDINTGTEYQTVSSRLDDGSPRYKVGDVAVFFPHNSIVPTEVLAIAGYVDDEGNSLFKGNRVKASNFKTVRSEGILWKNFGDYANVNTLDEDFPPYPLGTCYREVYRVEEFKAK